MFAGKLIFCAELGLLSAMVLDVPDPSSKPVCSYSVGTDRACALDTRFSFPFGVSWFA